MQLGLVLLIVVLIVAITSVETVKPPVVEEKIEEVPIIEEELEGEPEVKDRIFALLPGIENYPNLEQVLRDIYSIGGYREDEVEFMKTILNIYKEKPELKGYTKEVLYYATSWHTGFNHYDANYFNQIIIPLSKDITKNSENDLESAKAIQAWVKENIQYVLNATASTPKEVLEAKKGRCGEYANLIVAMCKAIGIPAREVWHAKAHGWEEVYVNGDWISMASTGALDYNNDQIIDYSDIENSGKYNKMVNVFIRSPFGEGNRIVTTFGYNRYIVEQMIVKAEDILNENYDLEAENSIAKAKELLLSWEKEKSVEKRHIIGKETLECALLAITVMREDATQKEVSGVYLEDFPPFLSTRIGFETICNTTIENSINENTTILYIFDTFLAKPVISSSYQGEEPFLNADAVQLARDYAKNHDFELILILISDETPPKIEYWYNEEIEALCNFRTVFLGESYKFACKFGDAIDIKNIGVVENTTYYLPPGINGNNYEITTIGKLEYEDNKFMGYSIKFLLNIKTKIGGLVFSGTSPIHQSYSNLIIINEQGEIFKPVENNGKYYYAECPALFINITAGQNLLIGREGDLVRITETGN